MDIVFKHNKDVFNYRVVAVWMENEHVLLHKQVEDTYWSLPGGRVVIGEASQESLKREMREELGIDVKVEQLVMVNENFFTFKEWDFHEIGFYYSVKASGRSIFQKGAFHGLEGDRLLYKWIPIEELSTLEIYPEVIKDMLLHQSNETQHSVSKN
ncbi:NUDIX hydrolase [Rossellomorea aquimaris]|uniref:NUDIX hydrolase n=1 Tax=Rossellomorea aquimaris TaxID=189382 RepID=UPI0005C9DD92|nr:NUDIX hydrolase [Rossellomorea aquimaris]